MAEPVGQLFLTEVFGVSIQQAKPEGIKLWFWALGVLCSVVASLCSSMGLVLQKYSHNIGEDELKFTQRRWFITGLLLLILGAGIFDSCAMALGPLSLIAPIAGITILFNTMLAGWVLGEVVLDQEIVAALVIFMGALVTTLFGDHDSPDYNADDLVTFATASETIIYFATMISIMAVSAVTLVRHRASLRAAAGAPKSDSDLHDAETDLVDTESMSSAQACTETLTHTGYALMYGFIAAQMGGISNISLKCFMTLVRASMRGPELGEEEGGPFAHSAVGWIALVSFVMCAVTQLTVLNLGLMLYDAVFFLMIYQSLFIVLGVVGGGLFFQEFNSFTLTRWILFPCGLGLNLCGLSILASAQRSKIDPDPTVKEEETEPLLNGA